MNWYLAKIVFRIICGDRSHKAQFDEQLRLIEAVDEKQAFEKARSIGEAEQTVFINQQKKLAEWKFIDVPELYRISRLIDGAELYSSVQETDNAELYTELIHKRSAGLQHNSVHKYLELL